MKHATDMFGSQAFVGTARSLRWSPIAKAPTYVGTNATAIHHRPSEDST